MSESTDQEPEREKRLIILVHGMGQPRPGEMLTKVVDSVSKWMDRFSKHEPSHVKLVEDPPPESGASVPNSITILSCHQEWKFVEAYWSDAFEPPRFDPLIGWTVYRLLAQLANLIRRNALDSLLPATMSLLFITIALVSIVPFIVATVVATVMLLIWFAAAAIRRYIAGITQATRVVDVLVIIGVIFVVLALIVAGYLLIRGDAPIVEITGVMFGIGAGLSGFISSIINRARRRARRIEQESAEAAAISDEILMNQYMKSEDSVSSSFAGRFNKTRGEVFKASSRQFDIANTRIRVYGLEGPRWAWLIFVRALGWSVRDLDEHDLYRQIKWGSGWSERLLALGLLLTIQIFHIVNTLVTIPLYLAGMILIVPVMFIVWLLSYAAGVPGVSTTVVFLKKKLDTLLVGSLGDIRVFMENPSQASRIRRRLHVALENTRRDGYSTDEIHVIAHSTGAAIAFETLSTGRDERGNPEQVESLITVGAIIRMAREMPGSRSAFRTHDGEHICWRFVSAPWRIIETAVAATRFLGYYLANVRQIKPKLDYWIEDTEGRYDYTFSEGNRSAPLHDLRWVNIWTRYDPAQAGPLRESEKQLARSVLDVPVSNEGDPFTDHSAYWDNHDQVVPTLVNEIWGGRPDQHFAMLDTAEQRIRKRKMRILALAMFRLPVWLLFPVIILGTLNHSATGDWKFLAEKGGPPQAEMVTGEAGQYVWVYENGDIAPNGSSWAMQPWAWTWDQLEGLRDETIVGPWVIDAEGPARIAVSSLVVAFLVTALARLVIYGFLRSVVWDGFIENLRLFTARPRWG